MDSYRFEVFAPDSPSPRLRWFDGDGRMVDRVLDRAAIDHFATTVESGYRVQVPDLSGLGSALYRWLDGPTERWLAGAQARQRPMLVAVDCEQRLRHLPWEIVFDQDFLAVRPGQPLCPVRRVMGRVSDPVVAANRPLRVVFMASSPTDVQPVLDFEHEESMILDAAVGLVDLIVEESGSLSGLRELFATLPDGHVDVLHLSGHALVGADGPRFVLEDEVGQRADASAQQIADAIGHRWPPLVFLSGCRTGTAPTSGEVASMAEALVLAGARAVLGWALPVGDVAATQLAAVLYEQLANGAELSWAVADARRALFDGKSRYWHLLRLYADASPVGPLVTAPGTPKRTRLRVRPTSELFLDPSNQVKVVAGEGFVGRRRELQRGLDQLRDPQSGPQVLLIHGMGGLGKSTLAARLLDRMRRTHPHQAVWVGPIDELEIGRLTERITLDADRDVRINQLLTKPELPLEARLRYVLDEPLADEPCLFVFDDFESGNLEPDGAGGYVCTAAALEIVTAFATAIGKTASASRVIITSRHDVPLPASVNVWRESLTALQGPDLDKKLRLMANLGPGGSADGAAREHALTASAGIPRLVERLDQLLGDPETDHERLLEEIDGTTVEFREELLLERLLALQQPEVRGLLARAAIFDIPVPVEAIAALRPERPVEADLARAVAVGLIESGAHPTTGERRYLVSNLLKPLLDGVRERLTDSERVEACGRGARLLYDRWVLADGD